MNGCGVLSTLNKMLVFANPFFTRKPQMVCWGFFSIARCAIPRCRLGSWWQNCLCTTFTQYKLETSSRPQENFILFVIFSKCHTCTVVWPNFCRTLSHILQGLPLCSRPITSSITKNRSCVQLSKCCQKLQNFDFQS